MRVERIQTTDNSYSNPRSTEKVVRSLRGTETSDAVDFDHRERNQQNQNHNQEQGENERSAHEQTQPDETAKDDQPRVRRELDVIV